MGESFNLVNLTDRVQEERLGKLGEILYYIGEDIITLIRGWINPFPDFAIPLECIERERFEAGITLRDHSQDSAFLSLPDEILWEIMSHVNPYYQDFLSMAMTCMHMLRMLAPVTTQVRCNMRKTMETKCHLEREWGGKRIVLLGEYTRPGKDWSRCKQHVRTQIYEAAARRGRTDLEDDIASAMSSLLEIGCPYEPLKWYECEEENEAEGDEEDGEESNESNPEAHPTKVEDSDLREPEHRDQVQLNRIKGKGNGLVSVSNKRTDKLSDVTESQYHLYQTCRPEAASRRQELKELLEMSYLDINQRTLVQLPIRVLFNNFARWTRYRSPLREVREYLRRQEVEEQFQRCRDEMLACEEVLRNYWSMKSDDWDCDYGTNDHHFVKLSCAFRPFRIINLDT